MQRGFSFSPPQQSSAAGGDKIDSCFLYDVESGCYRPGFWDKNTGVCSTRRPPVVDPTTTRDDKDEGEFMNYNELLTPLVGTSIRVPDRFRRSFDLDKRQASGDRNTFPLSSVPQKKKCLMNCFDGERESEGDRFEEQIHQQTDPVPWHQLQAANFYSGSTAKQLFEQGQFPGGLQYPFGPENWGNIRHQWAHYLEHTQKHHSECRCVECRRNRWNSPPPPTPFVLPGHQVDRNTCYPPGTVWVDQRSTPSGLYPPKPTFAFVSGITPLYY